MSKRRQPQIGDVFEISIPPGVAFFQLVNSDRHLGELIRVFPGVHQIRPALLDDLVSTDEQFLVFFPVAAAQSKKIVTFVGSAPVPQRLRDQFPTLRAPGYINPTSRKIEDWWLWDGQRSWRVEHLTDEQRKLSIKEVINDAMLIEFIVTGWTPHEYV